MKKTLCLVILGLLLLISGCTDESGEAVVFLDRSEGENVLPELQGTQQPESAGENPLWLDADVTYYKENALLIIHTVDISCTVSPKAMENLHIRISRFKRQSYVDSEKQTTIQNIFFVYQDTVGYQYKVGGLDLVANLFALSLWDAAEWDAYQMQTNAAEKELYEIIKSLDGQFVLCYTPIAFYPDNNWEIAFEDSREAWIANYEAEIVESVKFN